MITAVTVVLAVETPGDRRLATRRDWFPIGVVVDCVAVGIGVFPDVIHPLIGVAGFWGHLLCVTPTLGFLAAVAASCSAIDLRVAVPASGHGAGCWDWFLGGWFFGRLS